MKLDYIANINEYGENVVRLYDFNSAQAAMFRDALIKKVLTEKKPLALADLAFIEARNCSLLLRISEEDEGITSIDNKNFACDLTFESYEKMIALLEPFCKRETIGFQFLYDVDSLTDLLFSPGGTW